MEQNRTWNICYLKKFLKMDHKYSVSIALCMSGIPTKSFESHVLWSKLYKCIQEYWVYSFWSATSHSPVRVMCLRCYLADMERRGVLLTRSLLSWPRWREGGEYLLNMPRPVWQPSHYIRPVISLKLLHSKWLSRVRVICLSTGELEGGGGEILTHFCLFLNSIWGCWWWYWERIKGRFLVPGRTIFPTSASQAFFPDQGELPI